MQVFISYAREDKETAHQIYNDLKARGATCWIDIKDILPGEKWRDAITNAINKSSHFIAICSKSSISKDGFIQKELDIAFEAAKNKPRGSIFLIPLTIDGTLPENPEIKDRQCENIAINYEEVLTRIVKVFNLHKTYNNENAQIACNVRNDVRLILRCENFSNRVLFQYNRNWRQFLLPTVAYPTEIPSEKVNSQIISSIRNKYDINTEFNILTPTEKFSVIKLSKSLNQNTCYHFWHIIVDLAHNEQYCNNEKFKFKSSDYKWISAEDCVFDKKIYSGNEESIDVIAEVFNLNFPFSKRLNKS